MLSDIRKITASQSGMSLIEILIALTLLGLAGTFVATKVIDRLNEGQVQTCKIQIRSLSERLKEYRRDCGSYPTTEQTLEALVEKPTGGKECRKYAPGGYIENGKIPKDPWEFEYIYESDGKTFTIKSLGNDGVEDGEGVDADISSVDL